MESRLSVLSYNVHGLPPFVTGDDTLDRLGRIGPLLGACDLVGLQEDFLPEGPALLLEAAGHPTRERFAEPLRGRIYGAGLSLLARPRALAGARDHYQVFNGVLDGANDGLASKGFLMLRLELAPAAELDVWNTHMDAGGGPGDQEARAAQAAQLLAAIQERSAGRAVLLLGDTNLGRSERDQRTLQDLLQATGLRCACLCARERCCARIDRVLWRSGVGLELVPLEWGVAPGFQDAAGRPLSDHEPIRVLLAWRRAPL